MSRTRQIRTWKPRDGGQIDSPKLFEAWAVWISRILDRAPAFLLKPWVGIAVGALITITGRSDLEIRSAGLLLVAVWLSIDLWAWLLHKESRWRFVVGWTCTSGFLILAMAVMYWWLGGKLQEQRSDVFDGLRVANFSPPESKDDPMLTRFSVINDGHYPISGHHRIYCRINFAISNTGGMIKGIIVSQNENGLWYVPQTIPPLWTMPIKSTIWAGGDSETAQCLGLFSFDSGSRCVDMTLTLSYSLQSQPKLEQRKSFRFVANKAESGNSFYWYPEPIEDKNNYCQGTLMQRPPWPLKK